MEKDKAKDRDFDLASMERLVTQCDKNIGIFRAAIEKEEQSKVEYQNIIRVLREKEQAKALALAVKRD